jgi:hypothetical protein
MQVKYTKYRHLQIYKNIGGFGKHWRIQKTRRIQKNSAHPKNSADAKSLADAKTLAHQEK